MCDDCKIWGRISQYTEAGYSVGYARNPALQLLVATCANFRTLALMMSRPDTADKEAFSQLPVSVRAHLKGMAVFPCLPKKKKKIKTRRLPSVLKLS